MCWNNYNSRVYYVKLSWIYSISCHFTLLLFLFYWPDWIETVYSAPGALSLYTKVERSQCEWQGLVLIIYQASLVFLYCNCYVPACVWSVIESLWKEERGTLTFWLLWPCIHQTRLVFIMVGFSTCTCTATSLRCVIIADMNAYSKCIL